MTKKKIKQFYIEKLIEMKDNLGDHASTINKLNYFFGDTGSLQGDLKDACFKAEQILEKLKALDENEIGDFMLKRPKEYW
ncbi:MAG: hypothetical protein OXC92_02320 [Flavobacteriaceae bacterium]|nr:hypothetical protein [Flavobacteriaceae bacterium]MCY4215802.1 hypothetical protein [Flavobacteriaceae bacterium]MCY4266802.1 hypothetical protein [Flavobacteriaceae bacterium]